MAPAVLFFLMPFYIMCMNDEVIGKVFQVATRDVASFLSKQQAEFSERAKLQLSRERHYTEIQQHITRALNEIVAKARQQNVSNEYYESALTDLVAKISSNITAIRDEANKLVGAAAAYESALEKVNSLPAICMNELKKAQDLQQRAESGELDKPRKPGSRPDKLKDIRNYVQPVEDK